MTFRRPPIRELDLAPRDGVRTVMQQPAGRELIRTARSVRDEGERERYSLGRELYSGGDYGVRGRGQVDGEFDDASQSPELETKIGEDAGGGDGWAGGFGMLDIR